VGDDPDRDLHEPDGAVTAAAVVLHPHPSMGGDRHHPLVISLAEELARRGIAALRLDLRDPDLEAAARTLTTEAGAVRERLAVDRLLLVGYSWGAGVVATAEPAGLVARVLVAPPVTILELPPRAEPALVLVPAHDQYGPPDAVETALSSWTDATLEVVDGCDHFLAGAVARITDRAVAWLTDDG
jgi:alpha/beta superfamily hydrolase